MKTKIQALFIALAILTGATHVLAQSTAFTYQGQLNDNGSPANGNYDLSFTLLNAPTNGTVVGSITNTATPVTNGLFTAMLDFGSVFNGSNYWLAIAARTNGVGSFTSLTPVQPITPTPYAIYAENAGSATTALTAGTAGSANSVAGANITGTVPLAQLPAGVVTNNQSGVKLGGTFNGNGGGLTNLNATGLTGLIPDSLLSSNIIRVSLPNTNVQATANLVITAGFITGTTNLNGGSGYTNNPSVSVTDTTGSNAVIMATVANGSVTSLAVQSAGSHYSAAATLTIAPPPTSAYQTINAITLFNNQSNTFTGLFTGNASGLTNLNAANLNGVAANFSAIDITVSSNFYLPATTATAGIIYSAGISLIQSFGTNNFFAGSGAGNLTLDGNGNVGIGPSALHNVTVGIVNTAIGYDALANSTLGDENTAIGVNALYRNTTGSNNVATGGFALNFNTSGFGNTADGLNALIYNTVGNQNTANGYTALNSNTNGNYNIADGAQALYNEVNGNNNIAVGFQAGYNIFTGSSNIDIGNLGVSTDTNIIRIGSGQTQAFIAGVITGNGGGLTNVNLTGISTLSALSNSASGYQALPSDTTGYDNTANGYDSLQNNTTGIQNTANGEQALQDNISGSWNTAVGYETLGANTTGYYNSAFGFVALSHNTVGYYNTASGVNALGFNTSGNNNTADGVGALQSNTSGGYNTASGRDALGYNTTGSYSVANGEAALRNNTTASNNTASGYQALFYTTIGNYNIGLGYQSGYNITTGSSNIDIGNVGVATDTNIIRIGSGQAQTFIAGNVVVGGTSNGLEAFEVDGTDTAYSPGCSIRIHNTFDPIGGFIGDGWDAIQFGMYNPSSSVVGVIAPSSKRSFFGFDATGKVGSLANNFSNPSYRNLLDDGSGNMSIAGIISGNGVGLTNVNPTNINPGTAAINISGNAATATTANNVTGNITVSQLPASVPLLNATNTFAGPLTATNTNNVISGNGAGLVNIQSTAITGGANTNLLIGGHTFYITNGIIMAVQ